MMLRGMAHNAHRLSIEWSRIEPSPGQIDPGAVSHYRDVLECLRGFGITPFVTLHHFTSPLWLSQRGGFEDSTSVEAFRNYARLCANEYGDLVDMWTTFNEPNVYMYWGYLQGIWPPQKKDIRAAARASQNMLRAHAAAYAEIKSAPHGTAAQVGIAQNLRVFTPWRAWLPLDRLAAAVPDRGFNRWFLRGCTDGSAGFPLGLRGRVPEAAGTLDYIGVNYYGRDMIAYSALHASNLFTRAFPKPGTERSEFDWEIYPEGLYAVLMDTWRRYGKPMYITENGIADRSDGKRPRFIVSHLAEAGRTVQDGADLRGYMHWSSMDNFEWAEGYKMRFGLIEVDFATQARTPRPSAALYSRIIAEHGLRQADLDEHYPAAARYFRGVNIPA
jgi:beta-glucosidase